MMTLYHLKPRFQAMLRPVAALLAGAGVTANQVTIFTATASVALGLLVALNAGITFILIPLWLLVRMAFNAIDGILAREFNQKTPLGAYLNEIADVVSDTALYLPFAFIPAFGLPLIALVIGLAVLSEFAGVLGPAIGATRRHDGPMGKSDRALVFGILGTIVALAPAVPQWIALVPAIVAILLGITIFNRIRGGLRDLQVSAPLRH